MFIAVWCFGAWTDQKHLCVAFHSDGHLSPAQCFAPSIVTENVFVSVHISRDSGGNSQRGTCHVEGEAFPARVCSPGPRTLGKRPPPQPTALLLSPVSGYQTDRAPPLSASSCERGDDSAAAREPGEGSLLNMLQVASWSVEMVK